MAAIRTPPPNPALSGRNAASWAAARSPLTATGAFAETALRALLPAKQAE